MVRWQRKAETAVAAAWEKVKVLEKQFFTGDKSFVRSRIEWDGYGKKPVWPAKDFDQVTKTRDGYDYYGEATEAEQPVELEPHLAPEDNDNTDVKANPIRNKKRT